MATLNLITLCARYGKCDGEPFLRRTSTLEPTETPLKYYTSSNAYTTGNAASLLAWKAWKSVRHPAKNFLRTPYFELVDTELLNINHGIQAGGNDFEDAFWKLWTRFIESEKGEKRLLDAHKCGKKLQWEEWNSALNATRKFPPVLGGIYDDLQSKTLSVMESARKKLAQLCSLEPSWHSLAPTSTPIKLRRAPSKAPSIPADRISNIHPSRIPPGTSTEDTLTDKVSCQSGTSRIASNIHQHRKVGQVLSSSLTNDNNIPLPSDVLVRDWAYPEGHVLANPTFTEERSIEELVEERQVWMWAPEENLWIQMLSEDVEWKINALKQIGGGWDDSENGVVQST